MEFEGWIHTVRRVGVVTMAGHARAGGFVPHLPGFGHRFAAKALGASMWFFLFYRARQDGAVLLGLRHPWDGHH